MVTKAKAKSRDKTQREEFQYVDVIMTGNQLAARLGVSPARVERWQCWLSTPNGTGDKVSLLEVVVAREKGDIRLTDNQFAALLAEFKGNGVAFARMVTPAVSKLIAEHVRENWVARVHHI